MNNPQAGNTPGGIARRSSPLVPAPAALPPPPAPLHPLTGVVHDVRDPDVAETGLLTYWHVLLKRKWLVISVLATVLLVVLVATMITPSVYRATATLQIDLETIKVVQADDVTPGEGMG